MVPEGPSRKAAECGGEVQQRDKAGVRSARRRSVEAEVPSWGQGDDRGPVVHPVERRSCRLDHPGHRAREELSCACQVSGSVLIVWR